MAAFERLKAQPRNFLAIGILITIVSFGLSSGRLPVSPSASADSQRMVSLYVDGQKRLFPTNAATVGEAVSRAGVKLGEGDLVEPAAGTRVTSGEFNINVYRARPVLVADGGRSYHIRSAYQSPRLLALAAGLNVYAEDQYSTEVITDIVKSDTIGEKVVLKRAKPLVVKVDGKVRGIRTQAGTVGDALKGADIALGLKDTVSQSLKAPVIAGTTVAITRVTEAVVTLTHTLPHSTKTVKDPSMYTNQSVVQTAGSNGQKTLTYKIHYVDGKETSRQVLQVLSETAPVTKVVVVGTKVPDDAWAKLRMCEAGGDYTRNSGNGYYGAYQFDLSTWQSNGGTGYPHQAAPSVQDTIAKRLYARRGASPWPVCGRYLL